MKVHVRGGSTPRFKVRGYAAMDPVFTSTDSVRGVRNYLWRNSGNRLSALELKHGVNIEPDSLTGEQAHNCIYLLIDGTERLVFPVHGAAKGYGGEGARAALTIDAYLDLLNVPVARQVLCTGQDKSRSMVYPVIPDDFVRIVSAPNPRRSVFNLMNLARMKARARRARFGLPQDAGLNTLREDMPLAQAFEIVNYYDRAR